MTDDRIPPGLLSNRPFLLYLGSRLAVHVAGQMLSVAVAWQLYEMTGDPLALGAAGLSVFVPALLLALPGGHIADRYDRRTIVIVSTLVVAVSAVGLFAFSRFGGRHAWPIYGVLGILGGMRTFGEPAARALLPSLVKREALARAVAIGSSNFKLAMIIGPAAAGALYAASGHAEVVYGAAAAFALLAFVATVAMGHVPPPSSRRPPATLESLFAGLRYVWSDKLILGTMSLDLLAVLLGGAVALLPIFARDYLGAGPGGLGLLRAAPAVGAAVVAMALAVWPLRRRAGVSMLVCVFLFGVTTIVFGVSRSFALSLVSLFVLGCVDMISMVVRSTLIQTRTPGEVLGRVGAVNLVFVGASNELGEFESGVTAAWLGPSIAVVVGGVAACTVVLVWTVLFPQLRSVDALNK